MRIGQLAAGSASSLGAVYSESCSVRSVRFLMTHSGRTALCVLFSPGPGSMGLTCADYLDSAIDRVFTMSTCELHAAPCPTEDTALVQASCGRLRLFGSRRPRPQISGGRRRATAPRCRTTALGRTWSTTPTKTFWRSVTSLEWAWRPGCAAGLSCLSPLLSPRAPAANGTEIVAAASVRPRPRQRKRVIRTGCAVHRPAQVDRGRIDLGKLTATPDYMSARGMAAC